jgi:hypothetical protein
LPRERDGDWSVVKVSVERRDDPHGAVVEELDSKTRFSGGGYEHTGQGV